MSFIELNQRSLVKTFTYRFLIIVSNFSVTYFLTRSLALATSVAGVSFFVKTIIYYFHERMWNTITWGKSSKRNSI